MYNCVWYFCTYPYGLSLNGWHALLCIANNRYDVTITTHAIKRHFLIWMTTVRQPTKRRRSCVLTLNYTFICVYWWTRQRIHNTLIVVDRYLRLMGDNTIPDSAEPRLESFYPAFVAGIDLPHQGVVDSYNLRMVISMLKIRRPLGRLIFNMGIAIPGKTVFLIETASSYVDISFNEIKSDPSRYPPNLKTIAYTFLFYMDHCLSIIQIFICYIQPW